MNVNMYIYGAAAFLVLLLMVLIINRKRPRKLKHDYFYDNWQNLQKMCGDKDNWREALLKADALLGRALKKKKYKGKSFGEKLVSAQRDITDNDGVWFGHKLAKKATEEKDIKLKKNDMQDALMGIRQALKDLGALK